MSNKKRVSAEELTASRTVTLNGKQYPVKPIDGFGYQLLQNVTDESSLMTMYEVAAKCLAPGMTRDQVFGTAEIQGLSAEEIGMVMFAAKASVKDVEALASPNSEPAGSRSLMPS